MTAREGVLTDEQFAVVHHAGGHAYVVAARVRARHASPPHLFAYFRFDVRDG
jgi:hypothetical protein